MENEMVRCAIELFFFFGLYSAAGCHREMNILLCQEEKVMRLVLSIAAVEKLMGWFIKPRRAALLLSPKTFYLGFRSTYCDVWAERFTEFSFLLQFMVLK